MVSQGSRGDRRCLAREKPGSGKGVTSTCLGCLTTSDFLMAYDLLTGPTRSASKNVPSISTNLYPVWAGILKLLLMAHEYLPMSYCRIRSGILASFSAATSAITNAYSVTNTRDAPSSPALTIIFPSMAKAAPSTVPRWPMCSARSVPVRASHVRSKLSADADTTI